MNDGNDGEQGLNGSTEKLGVVLSIAWLAATILLSGLSAVLGWAVNGPQYGFYAPLVSHGIQWVVCTFHAYPFQTEKYYDFTGAVTYTTLTLFTLLLTVGLTLSVSFRQVVSSITARVQLLAPGPA